MLSSDAGIHLKRMGLAPAECQAVLATLQSQGVQAALSQSEALVANLHARIRAAKAEALARLGVQVC